MKNKSVKLKFVTKNSKQFRGNDLLPYEKQKCQVTICN